MLATYLGIYDLEALQILHHPPLSLLLDGLEIVFCVSVIPVTIPRQLETKEIGRFLFLFFCFCFCFDGLLFALISLRIVIFSVHVCVCLRAVLVHDHFGANRVQAIMWIL